MVLLGWCGLPVFAHMLRTLSELSVGAWFEVIEVCDCFFRVIINRSSTSLKLSINSCAWWCFLHPCCSRVQALHCGFLLPRSQATLVLPAPVGAHNNKLSEDFKATWYNFDCMRLSLSMPANAGCVQLGKSSLIETEIFPFGISFLVAGTWTSSQPFLTALQEVSGRLYFLLLIACDPSWNLRASRSDSICGKVHMTSRHWENPTTATRSPGWRSMTEFNCALCEMKGHTQINCPKSQQPPATPQGQHHFHQALQWQCKTTYNHKPCNNKLQIQHCNQKY